MSIQDYQIWWDREGSAMKPKKNEDIETFANRITEIAWMNGEYVDERENNNEVMK